MIAEQSLEPGGRGSRQRLFLAVVAPEEAVGFPIPAGDRFTYRGQDDVDLACGHCGQLLAIGAGPELFRATLLCSHCGTLNSAR